MRIDWTFLKYVLAILVGSIVLAVYPLGAYGTREVIAAACVGAALATANIIAGLVGIEYAMGRSMTTFMKVMIGGLGIRLLVLLAAIVVCIRFFDLDILALTISLFYFYVAFLALEVVFIQKRVRHRLTHGAGTVS